MGREKHKAPPFVMVFKGLLKDPKWRELSNSAKIIYIYLRSKFNTKTMGEVSLAYSEIEDIYSTKTISKSFKELREKGFIVREKDGGLYGGVCTYRFIGEYKYFYYKGRLV